MAQEVNFVWNYINELSARAWKQRRKWLTHYDLNEYTTGSTQFFKIGSATIQAINEEHYIQRKKIKRSKLKWRTKKKLGWVPFKIRQVKYKNGYIRFNGFDFKIWNSYGLKNHELRAGNFSQDNKGNWFLNVSVKFDEKITCNNNKAIGIDLGLKDLATYSNGEKFKGEKWFCRDEKKLAIAQRAGNKKRVKNIHLKIKNRRKDALHKESTRLVNKYAKIAVGNVDSSKLAKTRMAKSVLDAGWGMFRTMLEYKSRWASTEFKIVNESFTTQTCSNCGCVSGPKGLKGLGIREWKCSDCGFTHDRDVNAAKNIEILGFGYGPLAEENNLL
jgi:IS605 OrfB family transposase